MPANLPNTASHSPVIALISLYVAENNGLRFLAAALRQAGYCCIEIYLKDYQHHRFTKPTRQEIHLLLELLHQENVSLAGLSLRAGGYLRLASALTAEIKRSLSIPVIWGGMHVTMAPEECLQHTDYAVIGEAEATIVDIAKALEVGTPLKDIDNVWSHGEAGQIIKNRLRPLEANLDNIPLRDFHSHDCKYFIDNNTVKQGDPYREQTVFLMMTARGCLFNCSFCDISALRKRFRGLGSFYRTTSPRRVVEECLQAKQVFPKLKRFRFDDELFCMQPAWVREFSALYRDKVKLPFEILTDPRAVKAESLRELKAAGLDTIMMGIQNVSAINKKLYNRDCSDEAVVEAARIIHSLHLKPCYQILLDDPHVSESDNRQLFELLLKLPRPYDLYLFSLSYWPNTDITEHYLQDGTICLADIEGLNDKCLKQFRVDLAWPRPTANAFWYAIFTLLSKPLPLSWVITLSQQTWLREHPAPLVALAQFLNFLKLAELATQMLCNGELTWDILKRWVNFKSLATS